MYIQDTGSKYNSDS